MARKKTRKSGVLVEDEVKPGDEFEEGPELEAEAAASAGEAEVSSSGDGSPTADGDTASITSLWPARLIVNTPLGNRYVWDQAGATVDVAADDLPFLAEKNRKARACCGSSGERRYFDL